MKKLLVLLTLSVLFVGCGQIVEEGQRSVHAELEDYVQVFEKYSHRPVNYEVTLVADIPTPKGKRGRILGQCHSKKKLTKKFLKKERKKIEKRVIINAKEWTWMTQEEKALLIFHELYHCSYDSMGHNDRKVHINSMNCAVSVMHSNLPLRGCIDRIGFDKYVKTVLPLAPELDKDNNDWNELLSHL